MEAGKQQQLACVRYLCGGHLSKGFRCIYSFNPDRQLSEESMIIVTSPDWQMGKLRHAERFNNLSKVSQPISGRAGDSFPGTLAPQPSFCPLGNPASWGTGSALNNILFHGCFIFYFYFLKI